MNNVYGSDGFRVHLRCFSGDRVDRHCDTEAAAVKLAMTLLRQRQDSECVEVWDDATNSKVFSHGFAKLFFDKRREPEPLD